MALPTPPLGILRIHYAWVIALAGMLAVLAALGLGRFALGMLLPSMGLGLDLDYAEMGYISTANFVGYLAAVLVSGQAVRRWGSRRLISAGLLAVGGSMLLVSQAQGFVAVMLAYVLTGIGSGAANVPVMGLAAHWFRPSHRGRAAGIIVIGSGFAIMGSGSLIPYLNASYGAGGWRLAWLLLGSLSLVIALVSYALLRDCPAELGLEPVGKTPGAPPAHLPEPARPDARNILAHLGAIYFLFGFTYVIYATFFVTSLVQERGLSEAAAGDFWFWIGFLSLVSGPLFGTLSDHLGRRAGLMLVFGLQGLAYALVGLKLPETSLYLSVLLFGVCAWSIPSIMAAAVGDHMGPQRAAGAFGTITLFFGVGQITGPALVGALAEQGGGFANGFLLAAGLAGVAILLSALLPAPATGRAPRRPRFG